jgi:putative FmdB family regulatory protein
MPVYSFSCIKCSYGSNGELFANFRKFKEFRCPKCGSKVTQTFNSPIDFKIKGYCHENEYKQESCYRDILKDDRKTKDQRKFFSYK